VRGKRVLVPVSVEEGDEQDGQAGDHATATTRVSASDVYMYPSDLGFGFPFGRPGKPCHVDNIKPRLFCRNPLRFHGRT
jgi:hypothetical protein